jgi:hypothetical protein
MKLFTLVILGFISLNSIAQQTTDTIAVYDHHCESLNPFEIDTTYFWYISDTLYIRNIHKSFCSPTELKATVKTENDTIKIIVFRTGIDCLADCSFGYTIKLPLIQFDTLNIKIFDESFKVTTTELKTSLLAQEYIPMLGISNKWYVLRPNEPEIYITKGSTIIRSKEYNLKK